MTKQVKYLTISDCHLGNQRNKTHEIVKNFDIFFDDYTSSSQFVEMDIIFIAGDLFDTLLDFASNDIHEVTFWLSRLMHFCVRFNIKLRILEGTPSHDWKQSKIAETLAVLISPKLDFKYIDTLFIEHIKDIDLHVLYIPDEWNPNVDVTFSQVKELMDNLGIHQVDIGMLHGMFGYQLKNIPGNFPKHDEVKYLSIVKYFINIGHIHTFSTYDRILAEGSFDRMSHGEEEAKGGTVCSIRGEGGNHFDFIENKGAKIFKTIVVKYNDLDKAISHIDKVVDKLPINSYVRIKAKKDHAVYIAFEELKQRYPLYYFTKASLEDDTDKYTAMHEAITLPDDYSPISITNDNIVDLLLTEIKSKYSLTEPQLNLLSNTLENNRC